MSRYILSNAAWRDLDELHEYVLSLPLGPALRIGKDIQQTLLQLAAHPYQGFPHPDYSELAGENIRSSVAGDYVLFYSAARTPIVYLGVLHGKRDIDTIMRFRLER